MEYLLSELKRKSVISVVDGKKLGKISDVKLCLTSGKVLSFTVCNGISLFQNEQLIIRPCDIQTIGADAILIKLCEKRPCGYEERE